MAALLGGLGALLVSMPARAQDATPFPSDYTDNLHQRLLAERVNQIVNHQVASEVLGTLDVALSTAGIAVASSQWHKEPRFAATWTIGFGLVDGAAAASLFMSRDTRSRVLESIIYAQPVVVGLGFTLASDSHPMARLTAASATAGYFGAALLSSINAYATPTQYSTLRRDQALLEASTQTLSQSHRRTIHQHVLGARGPIPKWLTGLPLLAGGAVALSPAFNGKYDSNERTAAALVGGAAMLTGILAVLNGPVEAYEADLETLQISIASVPGGIGVQGAFTAL